MKRPKTQPRTFGGRLSSHTLTVRAQDYPILKRQLAKLRADFAEYVYANSEPVQTEKNQ
jgi:hypothetical protein